MPRSFFDSSALIKYYRDEPGSPEVRPILDEPGALPLLSRLAWAEVYSALARNVRMGTLTESDYARLQRRFRADIRNRSLRPLRMLNAHFEAAGDLISRHGPTRQLRALDAIQLAVALGIHRSTPLEGFVCADVRLSEVAALEGLAVINPEPRQ